MLHHVHIFLAQATDATDSGTKAKSGSSAGFFIMIAVIGVAMYFLLIRPQRRRMRDQQSLMSTIGEGDEVITSGGIYGFVTAVDGDVLWVEVDSEKGIEMRIHRSAITRKINPAVEPAGGEPVVPDDADADADGDESDKKNKK